MLSGASQVLRSHHRAAVKQTMDVFSFTHMYMCQEEGTRGIYGYYYIRDSVGYETFATGPRKHLLRSLLTGSVVAKSKQ